jgi:hypothetical protein
MHVFLGWYDIILIPTYECKWNFKEGDVAVLTSSRPGSGTPYFPESYSAFFHYSLDHSFSLVDPLIMR